MAEVVLFKTDLGETITNIKRLEEELKKLKSIYKDAEVGSKEYLKAQQAAKEVTAILKQQNDALKANTNALGGVNSAAKFAEGSYGKLKQQIKENRDLLDKLVIGSNEYEDALKEQARLAQQRIDIEKQLPSLFQERIKGAIDEANSIKGLKDQIKEYTAAVIRGEEGAAEKLAELKDKLEDVKDATETFKGSAVERLTSSMNLLQESLQNFDFDKFKLGLEGISAAFKAIPIILIIEGIRYLIDNFDELVKEFSKVDASQQALSESLEDYKKSATDAGSKVNEVAASFQLAKEGVISKEKALQTYNETLGDSFGKATDINVAEEIFIKKKDAYIQSVALRAQAQALFAKAAEEQVKSQTASLENNIGTFDYVKGFLTQSIFGIGSASEGLVNAQINNTKKIETDAKNKSNVINNLAKDLLKQSEQIDKDFNITSEKQKETEKKNSKDFEDIAKKRYDNEVALLEAAILAKKNLNQDSINEEIALEKFKLNAILKDNEKSNGEKIKAQQEYLQNVNTIQKASIERNQKEETAYLEAQIIERKTINKVAFEEEIELEKYNLNLILQNKELSDEEKYKAQVEFNAKMLDLEKQQIEYQKQLQDEAFKKDIEARQTQQNIIIEQEQAWNEVNFSDAMTTLETQFEAKQELLNLQREQELYGLEENSLKYQEIVAKYANQEVELLRQKEAEKAAIRTAEIKSVTDTAQVILNLGALLAKDQQQQAAFAKMAALINIGANTATAISNLTATSFSVSSPDNILTGGLAAYAKLATGLVTITSNMVQAKQLLNSFEEGGYTGEGNPHEQSTNLGTKSYTYHKDEYVIPSRVLNTQKGSMLASQLEGMRLGMSNPMPHISGMFDGGFTGRSASSSANMQLSNQAMMERMMLSMPQPVVRVTDINKTQTSVERAVQVSSL